DANNQAKATFDLAKNLAEGKGAADGTNWKIENKIVRVPYVGVVQMRYSSLSMVQKATLPLSRSY
ncbi:hypothetical protein MJI95_38070, partial [Salmonella enterica subsp. enterica serovar Kentucky]|nr:hypothetical protein [Salmonella enterica subsp. enterica serovar Kentucky]